MLAQFANFAKRANGRRTAIFLDYDGVPLVHYKLHSPCSSKLAAVSLVMLTQHRFAGTLTPIVKDPDLAFMSEQVNPLRLANARIPNPALGVEETPSRARSTLCTDGNKCLFGARPINVRTKLEVP